MVIKLTDFVQVDGYLEKKKKRSVGGEKGCKAGWSVNRGSAINVCNCSSVHE